MKRIFVPLMFLISTALVSAYHGTTQTSGNSGGGSWLPIIIVLVVFVGGIWAFWNFVLEDRKL